LNTEILANQDYVSVSRILNLPMPSALDEPARLRDLNAAIEGLSGKDNCRVSTQANIDLASPGATIDGIAMASGDRVLVRQQSNPAFNGIYVWQGAAAPMTRSADANTAAELKSAIVSIAEGSDVGNTYRQISVNFALDTDPITWVPFGNSTPPASTTTAGVIQIATQAEADAGAAANLAIVPATLSQWEGRRRKAAATFGDGSATQYDISHGFDTYDVQVQVFRAGGTRANVGCVVERPTTNAVRLIFSSAPALNSLRAVIIG
jgi:hypothetical protein